MKILFINALTITDLTCPTDYQAFAHSAADYQASTHSAAKPSPTLRHKTRLYTSYTTQSFILIIIIPLSIDYLEPLSIYTIPWSWVDLYSQHYITKLRMDNPMTHLQNTHFATKKCEVFTSGLQLLIKIWALSPKTSLRGSRTQKR